MARPKNCWACRKPKSKCTCWRKTKFTEDTLNKLYEAYERWCTDAEACLHAWVSDTALYNYQNKNKEFVVKKNQLREKPVLLARKTVIQGFVWWSYKMIKKWKEIDITLPPNPDIALKYLERKKKDEFSTRSEVTGKDWEAIQIRKIWSNENKND